MNVKWNPAYPLDKVKELAQNGRFRPTMRGLSYLDERYGDEGPKHVIKEVISELEERDFVKSIELRNRPGVMADVYIGGWYDDTEWYVKAFIEDDSLTLQIWSMAWDGSLH